MPSACRASVASGLSVKTMSARRSARMRLSSSPSEKSPQRRPPPTRTMGTPSLEAASAKASDAAVSPAMTSSSGVVLVSTSSAAIRVRAVRCTVVPAAGATSTSVCGRQSASSTVPWVWSGPMTRATAWGTPRRRSSAITAAIRTASERQLTTWSSRGGAESAGTGSTAWMTISTSVSNAMDTQRTYGCRGPKSRLPARWSRQVQPDGQPPGRAGLLDRDGLGQVARLIDVQATQAGDAIGEQLERDHGQDRLQHPVGAGHVEHVGRVGRDPLVPLGGDGDDVGAAGADLLHVGDHLVEHGRLGRHHHDGRPLLEQGDRPVLLLPGRVGVRGDVGDLLELERALEAHGEAHMAPEVEEEVLAVRALGDRVDGGGAALGDLRDGVRQALEVADELG